MKERLKELRKTLNLSQEEFGNKLGVTKATISRLESGTNKLTEQMIKSICREFNVDYYWLTDGIGEMFTHIPETLIEEICKKYNLDLTWVEILKKFLELSDSERKLVEKFLITYFKIKDD